MATIVHVEERLTKPPVATDREVVRSSGGDDLRSMMADACADCPDDMVFNGYRYVISEDMTGKRFYNLTVYFTHEVAKPQLDPNNLNGAEQAVFGQVLTAQELADKRVGASDFQWMGAGGASQPPAAIPDTAQG